VFPPNAAEAAISPSWDTWNNFRVSSLLLTYFFIFFFGSYVSLFQLLLSFGAIMS
jgi:hypothetical protein